MTLPLVPPLAIAPNDSRLAHGAARSLLTESAHLSAQFRRQAKACVGKSAPKRLHELVHSIFGRLIVQERVDRLSGTRAFWAVGVVLPSSDEGGSISLMVFAWRNGLIELEIGRVDRHALARILQRSIGRSDLDAAVERVRPHLAAMSVIGLKSVLEADRSAVTRGRFRLVGRGGLSVAAEGPTGSSMQQLGLRLRKATARVSELRGKVRL